MDKKYYIKLVNNYFKNNKVRKVFYEQIDLFFNKENVEIKKYSIGDLVELYPNYLIHGTKSNVDNLKKIKESGLLAVEFYDKEYENQKKPYIHVNFGILKKELHKRLYR